jgi:predicted ATPase
MIYKLNTKKTGIDFDFNIELEKDQKLYCFIGKNGIGKTQLLENMAKTLIFTHSIFQKKDTKFKFSNLFMQNTIHEKVKDYELKLPLEITVNEINIKNEEKHPWGYTKFENIPNNVSKDFVCDKPIVFIGAKNRGFTANIDPNNIKILGNSQSRFIDSIDRTMKYINEEGLEHEEVANWFVSRLIVNPNFVVSDQNKTNEVITVLKLIERLEPSLKLVVQKKDGSNSLSMLYHEGQLYINNIPLDKLSTGFVSIIKIFQEIVAGYGGWSNTSDLSAVDGVVFIDEIEPHLHIGWQTKIINILREFFPNTTFYISTHSPLVLAEMKEGEAYELYKEKKFVHAKKIKNIDNYFLNDIVYEFFGVDLNKNKVENPNKEKQEKAKKILLELTKVIDGDSE